jgi:hypothetical protein
LRFFFPHAGQGTAVLNAPLLSEASCAGYDLLSVGSVLLFQTSVRLRNLDFHERPATKTAIFWGAIWSRLLVARPGND